MSATSIHAPAVPSTPSSSVRPKRSVQIRRPPGALKNQNEPAKAAEIQTTPLRLVSSDHLAKQAPPYSRRQASEPSSPYAKPCRNVPCTKPGCPYNHSPQPSTAQAASPVKSPRRPQAKIVDAPVFVPKAALVKESPRMTANAPAWVPSNAALLAQTISRPATQQSLHDQSRPYTPDSADPLPDHHNTIHHFEPRQPDFSQFEAPQFNPFANGSAPPDFFNPYDGAPNGNVHETTFFDGSTGHRPEGFFSRQPLYYHLYQGALPSVSAHSPHQMALNNFFISPSLREDLTRRAEACVPAEGTEIPGYFGLIPLDTPTQTTTLQSTSKAGQKTSGIGVFGVRNWVYRAVSEVDGQPYVLRRLEGYRLTHESSLSLVERWRRIRHPGLVSVREAFTTRGFGDSSLVFVFDYHPLASTLYDVHLSPQAQAQAIRNTPHHRPNQPPPLIPERILWSYIIQLANVIKTVHSNQLAVRTIDLTKILVTGKHRIRVNCCSILDVIRTEQTTDINALRQEDLYDFGRLILSLACNSPIAQHNLNASLEMLARSYTPDLTKLILFLFAKASAQKTIEDAFAIIGTRILDEMNALQTQGDTLESELMRELENGRLVRLLSKFGFINERPEFDHDPRWAESGDRYLIKLFRDFVFHQVDDAGRPVVDLSHVLTHLNKLDAGIDDRMMLVSRDGQNCLIVTYREIKHAIEAAYRDLSRA